MVLGAIIVGAVCIFVVPPLALMHRSAGTLEASFGNAMVNQVASMGAGGNPPSAAPRASQPGVNLAPGTVENAGRNAYTGSCAQCHGATGDGKGVLGQSTFPPATDLTSADAKGKSDAQLLWIVKNGLGFTAMPAYGDVYSDQDLVAIVAYVRALQKGQARVAAVPTPTSAQLSFADLGGTPVQHGAAVYFAQGCQQCHGAFGDAPDELAIQDVSDIREPVRNGRPGMPVYSQSKLSDADLAALQAYLQTGPPQ